MAPPPTEEYLELVRTRHRVLVARGYHKARAWLAAFYIDGYDPARWWLNKNKHLTLDELKIKAQSGHVPSAAKYADYLTALNETLIRDMRTEKLPASRKDDQRGRSGKSAVLAGTLEPEIAALRPPSPPGWFARLGASQLKKDIVEGRFIHRVMASRKSQLSGSQEENSNASQSRKDIPGGRLIKRIFASSKSQMSGSVESNTKEATPDNSHGSATYGGLDDTMNEIDEEPQSSRVDETQQVKWAGGVLIGISESSGRPIYASIVDGVVHYFEATPPLISSDPVWKFTKTEAGFHAPRTLSFDSHWRFAKTEAAFKVSQEVQGWLDVYVFHGLDPEDAMLKIVADEGIVADEKMRADKKVRADVRPDT